MVAPFFICDIIYVINDHFVIDCFFNLKLEQAI